MSNPEHVTKLKEDVEAWNEWRKVNTEVRPDFSEADLRNANLSNANLSNANLSGANLSGADLSKAHLGLAHLSLADLSEADLRGANLFGATLSGANLRGANLSETNLRGATLSEADLRGAALYEANLIGANLYRATLIGARLIVANLQGANLSEANLSAAYLSASDLRDAKLSAAKLNGAYLYSAMLVRTNLEGADLTSCSVHGISVWDVNLEKAVQLNLVITPKDEPVIQVDNLEVAQFVYLLLNNAKIRHVIDTITSKVVLILGRFTAERKVVLDAIRDELRKRDYVPVLFDFEKPSSRDITETVRTLAHMARFVIADITDAKSIPQELMAIVPNLPSVPVQPVLLASQHEYGMFEHFLRYPWVSKPVLYESQEALLVELQQRVIAPAEAKAKELTQK
jgi:uncharacterized protein YjbI with pentapeptide repeats